MKTKSRLDKTTALVSYPVRTLELSPNLVLRHDLDLMQTHEGYTPEWCKDV